MKKCLIRTMFVVFAWEIAPNRTEPHRTVHRTVVNYQPNCESVVFKNNKYSFFLINKKARFGW